MLVTGKIQCMNQLFVYMTHIPTHLYHKVETNPPNIDENDGEACVVKKQKTNKSCRPLANTKCTTKYSVTWSKGGGPNLILNDIYILLISIFFSYS